MTSLADPRLERLLGGNHLASLRKRLRRRFEHAPLDGTIENIRVGKLTSEEHAALASLLGRSQRYCNSLRINVRRVDAGLQRAGISTSLRSALEQLDGPISNTATARLHLQSRWSEVVGHCTHSDLIELLRTPTGLGLLKRLSKREPSAASELCRRAEAVLQRLPAKGIARSRLAADALGDAHALDGGQGTATLLLAVLRKSVPPADDADATAPVEAAGNKDPSRSDGAERDRDIWAKAGVLVNELARPALFLNLPEHGHGRPLGEPAYASLRSLLRSPPTWNVLGLKVHICENPNLLAIAADHLGRRCAPLVCTDGMPAAAQRCLLSQLTTAGARLCYHGDFDWPGLRIGNHLVREHGVQPWRFGAADYALAIDTVASRGQYLGGRAVDAIWDKELTLLMQHHRASVAEEALADLLMQDLDNP